MIPNHLAKCFFILSIFFATFGYAEEPPEGVDFIGGYFEDGEYKCYAEPCFTLHKDKYPSANNVQFQPKAWPVWLDIDRNCQKENLQAIVEASLVEVTYKDNNSCTAIIAGQWEDTYSGKVVEDADKITVDWLVSLQEAHVLGGFSWKRNKRALFANLPENLVVVSTKESAARGGRPAHEWMPSNKRYWCDYIVGREQIFRKFKLDVSDEEIAFNKEIKRLYCKY